MNTINFGIFTKTASRRGSLLALGGAGLATLIGASGAAAKPKAGKAAKNKFKTRCKAQVGRCRSFFIAGCASGQAAECEATFLPCCDFLATCNGVGMLECVISGQAVND
jgi:hypothetical protein